MVRVVRLEDGSLVPGRTLPGRGAWLCLGSVSCVDTAYKRRAYERALRGPVASGAVDDLRRTLEWPAGGPGPDGSVRPVP
jgi:predicted RNA-binding protein YlxR (DUF448 family)